MSEVTNYAQFYTQLKRMPYEGDKEDLKRSLVRQFTNGRTDSLHEITRKEYDDMIIYLNSATDNYWRSVRPALRKHRSTCLHLMQMIGVDTANWNAVNAYCRSPRIAGAEFRNLSIDELCNLSNKLRSILKKQEK